MGIYPYRAMQYLSLIHISEPTKPLYTSYAVFCLKKVVLAAEVSVDGVGGGEVEGAFFNDTATTEIYTLHIVGSVRCV